MWQFGRFELAGHSLGATARRQLPAHTSWPVGHETGAGGDGDGGDAPAGGGGDGDGGGGAAGLAEPLEQRHANSVEQGLVLVAGL